MSQRLEAATSTTLPSLRLDRLYGKSNAAARRRFPRASGRSLHDRRPYRAAECPVGHRVAPQTAHGLSTHNEITTCCLGLEHVNIDMYMYVHGRTADTAAFHSVHSWSRADARDAVPHTHVLVRLSRVHLRVHLASSNTLVMAFRRLPSMMRRLSAYSASHIFSLQNLG